MSSRIRRAGGARAEAFAPSIVAGHAISRMNQTKRNRAGTKCPTFGKRIGIGCLLAVLVGALLPTVVWAQSSPTVTRASLVDGRTPPARAVSEQDSLCLSAEARINGFGGPSLSHFGASVAVGGDTLIVGEPGVGPGRAYVFQRNQGGADNWGLLTQLMPGNAGSDSQVGRAVAIDGDTAIVTAPNFKAGLLSKAFVFERNEGGPNNWGLVASLIGSDIAPTGSFGWSAALSGDIAVVGDFGNDVPVEGGGAVYVFRRDDGGLNNWGEVAKLTAPNAGTNTFFGNTVSISGHTILVGTFRADKVYFFRCFENGPNECDQVTILAPEVSDGLVAWQFGSSVSIDGNLAAVGSHDGSPSGDHRGIASFYERNPISEEWNRVARPVSGSSCCDDFGKSVAVLGDIVVVGAPSYASGRAFVYQRDHGGVGNWGLLETIAGFDLPHNSEDKFGESVALDRGTVAVGAVVVDNVGAAYVHFDTCGNGMIDPLEECDDGGSVAGDGCSACCLVENGFVCNGEPSICILDCNANGIVDSDEIADGSSFDCNENGTLDECEIDESSMAPGGPFFCMISCDPDCNNNGIPDNCDVPDADGDGVPDECDVCPGFDDKLDDDGDSVPNDCDQCEGGDDNLDEDGNGVPDACDLRSPISADPPHDILKNRYISIDPRGEGALGTGALPFDIQVLLSSTLVNGVTAVGESWWANAPDSACISIVGPTQPASPPDWSACPTLHLTGCPVIPTSTYEIVTVAGGLSSVPPLVADTQAKPGVKWHGDIVGFFNGEFWTPPNSTVSIDDAVAIIKAFQNINAFNAPHLSVADLHPNMSGTQINRIVNFDDVLVDIFGFGGQQYPGPQIELCEDP